MNDFNYRKLIELHNMALLTCSKKYRFHQAINAILTKFYSNLTVYNMLYCEIGYYNEARIVIRSAIESVILFSYLMIFPEKIHQYEIDSIMLEFKNNFIIVKELLFKEISNEMKMKIDKDKILEEHYKFFLLLNDDIKNCILNVVGSDKYVINISNFHKLDLYLQKFKPKFQNFEKIYKEIDDSNCLNINIRDLLFSHYNKYSQIQHVALYKTLPQINKYDIIQDNSLIKRLLYIIVIVCDATNNFIDSEYKNLINNEIKYLNKKMEFKLNEKTVL